MGKLDGKVAIITGGSGGIGKAAGRLFAAEGARVMLVDLDEEARETAAEVGLTVARAATPGTEPDPRFVEMVLALVAEHQDPTVHSDQELGNLAPVLGVIPHLRGRR